jgi:crossover junction endodeoxyribonuclease RuvC
MIILGIDPALAVTGYGIVDFSNNKLTLLKAGAIVTTYGQPLPERLDKIYEAILKLVNQAKPQVMVLEKIYVHYHHPTTAFLLGQARGIICLACAKGKLPLIEYAATRVKKAVVGKGLASKEQVQKMVMKILNLKTIPQYSDVTDALALAIAYSYFLKTEGLKLK